MWRELRKKGRPLAAPARLLRRQPPDQGHRVGRRSRGKYGIIGRTGNAIGHIAGEEAEGIAGCVLRYGVDRDLAERSRGSIVLVVPSLGRVVGRIALLAKNGDEVEGDRPRRRRQARPRSRLRYVSTSSVAPLEFANPIE